MKPLILGTAGHIDHGKTSLVKALTGVDTDRLKEEKARGITIELGFASLTLPSGQKVGVVDVPGHEKFVKNMVAGATGIDVVALVIAADEGVMPQTREQAIAAGQSLFKSIDPKVVLNDFLACDRFDVMEKISRIDIPTLVVAGTHDQLTPQKYGEYLAKNIPGAQLVVLSGAGHMMPLEKAEEFCLALENFIKG